MIVYAFWDSTPSAPEDQAVIVAAWYERCLKAGKVPRLLTARDALKSKAYKDAVIAGLAHYHHLSEWAFKAKRAKHVELLW